MWNFLPNAEPSRRLGLVLAAGAAWLLAGNAAHAHPMGNFAICHYTRLEVQADSLRIRHILDFAEIPTFAEKTRIDRDGDGVVSAREQQVYLDAKVPELFGGLTLRVNGEPARLRRRAARLQFLPGAAGLETMQLILDLDTPLPYRTRTIQVFFRDGNYAERTGWKEIIALAGTGFTLRGSSVPSSDQSRELTAYPTDTIPPQDTEARFTVVPSPGSATAPLPEAAAIASGPVAAASATPRDAFTQVIASPDLGPGVVVAGLAIAAVFGALHGLSPGHGKAMMAAYLVGARGTAGQAVFLGGVVTVTHTLGVFALGLATLLASRYVVPERLYPVLSALSGLMICGVGGRLLYLRIRRLLRPRPPAAGAANHHHHLPSGPVTVRGLLALGVSGGLIPCPSALVVLLAAVALHRVAFGMLLITAFSLGLAGVLMAVGLLVVYARQWLERVPVSAALLRRVPIASAGVITLIGVGLLVRTLGGGGP